jgi:SAM-dependent methyltransferase
LEVNNYKKNKDLIYVTDTSVNHRDAEYDTAGFEVLSNMQENHFWYIGRHNFLYRAVQGYLPKCGKRIFAIDFGGGAGGWIKYLAKKSPNVFGGLATSDSSLIALEYAARILPSSVDRYQIDLMRLQMTCEWDVAFMLDVIEHLPDDLTALKEARDALKPGGLLFITAPAFPQFWSYNDDVANHLRRYRKVDFEALAKNSGLNLLDVRYFMFFLSPLYFLSRLKIGRKNLSVEQLKALVEQQHKIPNPLLNKILTKIFSAETPLGHYLHFPWGTSILGVFKKE